MSARLQIGVGLEFPPDFVTQTSGILGKRGVGKTHVAGVMAEELLEHGMQVVVLDPIGVWWGLRTSASGKGPGYQILILGGEHGDLPLEPTAGKLVADFVVTRRASVVLDMGAMSKSDQARFVTEFLERVYHTNRAPLHLVIDEADAFAPQRIHRGAERCFGAVDTVVRRGRARGLGVTLVTQRSAAINKDVLTQIEVLLAFRTIAPQDRAAIEAWVEVHGDAEGRKAMLASLHELKKGECWVWSPSWLEVLKRVQVRRRRTFDSSATPEVGSAAAAPRKVASVDLDAFKTELASLVQKADQEDPRRLRTRIAQLERELAAKPAPAAAAVKRVEVPVVSEAKLEQLARELARLGEKLDLAQQTLAAWKALQHAKTPAAPTSPAGQAAGASRPHPPAPNPVHRRTPASSNGHAGELAQGPQRMLVALARRWPNVLTRDQLGVLSGYAARGGTFRTYLPQLIRAGLVVAGAGGLLQLTTEGQVSAGGALGAAGDAASTRQMWLESLPAGPARMLRCLIESYPLSLSRDELGAASGYEAAGGTFRTYFPQLKRLGLVDESGGQVRANADLMGVA